ncbi:DUF4956 domain-containing protein [Actinomyces marmotae]|uniref:DUF4956 domain-containing protein n=1 Tax=Actinomyces marmotae TaxID=2737173 RepID=A0A6M8B1D3_9ACTO|nr:DUF4956 domain-containing protein [Actinomyces marmotae]QKD80434.1 DUF4956 domain-containing protein [Actinomyces marmotae]
MTALSLAYMAADITALSILVGALYSRRHHRKDLVAAYIGVNIGVLAVTLLLSTASVAAGLGLGLFGVLSIIRLRSTELEQHEVAYFFAALALGLLGGIQTASLAMVAALMALVVVSLWIGDHPALLGRNRHQIITVDRAIPNEAELKMHLASLLGGTVRSLTVQSLDLVNDTTLVDVRYTLPRSGAATAHLSGWSGSAGIAAPMTGPQAPAGTPVGAPFPFTTATGAPGE